MAYGNPGSNPGPSMMDDAGPSQSPEQEMHEEKGPEGETTLIPKSMGMGKDFKVGDEIVLEITAIHDDQFEVKYASEKGGEGKEEYGGGGEESPMPAAPPSGGGGMGGMYE